MRDVVADINAANVQVTAVPLSDSKRAQLVVQTVIIPRTGVVLRHDRLAHIRYTDQLRIRAMRPRARSAREAWFPRVLNGAFTQRSGGDTYRYEIHDYHYQIFHQTYGEPYRAVLDEEPVALSNKRWRLSRAPIRSRGDIRIFIDEVEDNSVLDQVDLNNGILFLNRTLDPNADLRISYVYEDTSFTYTDINLNPTLRHNPIFLGKYVGLYILPRTIVTPSMAGAPTPWTVTNRERTVFHVMRNSAQEIINLVPTMVLSDGSSAHALLLAIYHVRQTTDPEDDIEIVDTRQAGGGLRPDLGPADVDEEEAEFYADVGGHFDGEPFPDAATLVVEIAETIPLDATGEVCRVDLYDSVGSTGVIDPSGWVDPSGILTRDEIHQKILRHVDAGAFVVEDYYLE
ncbi:MAG: hypothetical protein GTN93_00675 [Anaerolineae bacterium]|nr:hypothetical protein [Anaerolineae bacterium]